MTKRTVSKIENEIEKLIEEGVELAQSTNQEFNVMGNTFYPGQNIKEMCDPEHDNYMYLDDWYCEAYGETGKWMSSSDFC